MQNYPPHTNTQGSHMGPGNPGKGPRAPLGALGVHSGQALMAHKGGVDSVQTKMFATEAKTVAALKPYSQSIMRCHKTNKYRNDT